MAAIPYRGWEYSRFGDGWLRRERESSDPWQTIDDVPEEVTEQDANISQRQQTFEVIGGVQPSSAGDVVVEPG